MVKTDNLTGKKVYSSIEELIKNNPQGAWIFFLSQVQKHLSRKENEFIVEDYILSYAKSFFPNDAASYNRTKNALTIQINKGFSIVEYVITSNAVYRYEI